MSTFVGNPCAACVANTLGQLIGDKETRGDIRKTVVTTSDNLLKNVAASAGSNGFSTSRHALGWKIISGVCGTTLGEVGGTVFNKTVGKFFCGSGEQNCSSTNSGEQTHLINVSVEQADGENLEQSTSNGDNCTFLCRKLTRATVAGTVATISEAVILNCASAGTFTLAGVGYSVASMAGGYAAGKLSGYLFSKIPSMILPNNDNLVRIKKALDGTQTVISITASTGFAYITSAGIHYFIDFLQGDPNSSCSGSGNGNSTLSYA